MGNVTFGVILALLASLIMLVNCVVVIALVRLVWKNHCPGLCFVLNLAISDYLVGFTITGLVNEELSGPEYQTTQLYCVLQMASITCPSAASIFTVILVTFDRYLAITHPFRYLKIMCGPVVGICIGGPWLLACLIGFLPVMAHSFQEKDYQGLCTFFGVFQPTYTLVVFCVSFFPVFFIFLYFHCRLLKIASLHIQHIRELEPAGLPAVCPTSQPSNDTKALRTVAILVGCFAFSWSPFFVVSIVQIACRRCYLHRLLEHYLWVLGVCNSLANPLVYGYWQKEVRLEICQMCLCLKNKIFPLLHLDSQPDAAPTQPGGPLFI
ncbi:glucose-dependent insulinotropic receptor [Pantherophis guttatus]|uniref:Glucose-dependent insulinotropic receptor n=1 Tax=Pantherophis guttatus TaxID=94885 RepID=A0A6P9CLB1_PANGU|nr:glucose-dependent insulinotropic receptor [Pantherophis guttatus]